MDLNLEMITIPVTPESGLAPFELMAAPVTQAQWVQVMGSNPSRLAAMDHPVENVSWDDCQQFVERLRELTGMPYRLPSEEEWEWAANGGEDYEYAGSNDPNEVAWYADNSEGEHHSVKQKKPNGYGLYDMSGNVWEWTSSQEGSCRVNRGGSWRYEARFVRVAIRSWNSPLARYGGLGLRLARSTSSSQRLSKEEVVEAAKRPAAPQPMGEPHIVTAAKDPLTKVVDVLAELINHLEADDDSYMLLIQRGIPPELWNEMQTILPRAQDLLRSRICRPKDSPHGLDKTPTQYTAEGREMIDRQRDYCYWVALKTWGRRSATLGSEELLFNPHEVQIYANELFITHCHLQAMEYRDQTRLKESGPIEHSKTAFFYEQMAAHVQSGGKIPDPRCVSPGFQPYVRQE
jgi:hypothetical protein